MPERPVNATVGSLLGFLHDGPQSGWDLVATAQQQIGEFWSLTRSQVYRELATMAEQGLVTAEEAGPRDRRAYRLTPAGRRVFRQWLAQEPGPEQIRYPLLLTLAFRRHLRDDQVAGFLRTHRAVHQSRLARYVEEREAAVEVGATAPDLMTLDFGITYERAVLEWFDGLPNLDGA